MNKENNTSIKDFLRNEGLLIEHNKDRLYNSIIYFLKYVNHCCIVWIYIELSILTNIIGKLSYNFNKILIKELL